MRRGREQGVTGEGEGEGEMLVIRAAPLLGLGAGKACNAINDRE